MMRFGGRAVLVAVLCGTVLLAAAPAVAQAAAPGDEGTVFWNEDYELGAGQVWSGDVVVFNGDAVLAADSRVEGSIVVWNGDVSVEGTITGDLVVSGGTVSLGDEAVIRGNLVCTWSCGLVQEEGARIEGRTVQGLTIELIDFEWLKGLDVWSPGLAGLDISGPSIVLRLLYGLVRTAFGIVVVTAVAALVRAMWPQQTAQVGAALVGQSAAAIGFGLLTVVVAGAVLIVLTITICLIPVAFVGGMALVAAALFGWSCVGAVLGERLLAALNVRDVAPPWAAALGTFLLSVVSFGLSSVPGITICLAPLGSLVAFAAACLGLGAVVLTRFGTTAYPASVDSALRVSEQPVSEPAPKPKRQRKAKGE